MGAERFAGESAQNLEQKCLCVLVLDVSGSMRGDKLNSLNQGVRDFFTQIQTADGVPESLIDQLEIAIMQYDEEIKILRDPKLLEDGELPPTLTERGSVTETVIAIEEAIKLVEDRKAFYKSTGQSYYRPWIIVMTDGEPYGKKASDADIEAISQRVKQETSSKKYMIMGIGVGSDANMEVLKKMTAGRAMALQGLKFGAFFEWLSNSLSVVASSKEGDKIDISDGASNWMSSFEI
ncbi:VWA domain-containing protein [Bacteroides gallinaceum]|uniref:vWA domain-containing protein n=1 Tax=Bacteroides gallinaceum TaxID=1462571 RepID=UPI0025AA75E5|nr:VWA domain-containing protein [Bacteroides gallinaceum]MDN0080664.1 VWA domain-containing protein [Bacteroides gallinaceum]